MEKAHSKSWNGECQGNDMQEETQKVQMEMAKPHIQSNITSMWDP